MREGADKDGSCLFLFSLPVLFFFLLLLLEVGGRRGRGKEGRRKGQIIALIFQYNSILKREIIRQKREPKKKNKKCTKG